MSFGSWRNYAYWVMIEKHKWKGNRIVGFCKCGEYWKSGMSFFFFTVFDDFYLRACPNHLHVLKYSTPLMILLCLRVAWFLMRSPDWLIVELSFLYDTQICTTSDLKNLFLFYRSSIQVLVICSVQLSGCKKGNNCWIFCQRLSFRSEWNMVLWSAFWASS